jgi:aerobic carbon-monoxide dehydrogenase small subunit
MTTVRITINGTAQKHDVEDRTLLIHYIRENSRLTSNCGACTVLLNGEAVKSCTVLAVQADGEEVTTVEGISGNFNGLSAVQEGFRQEHGLQCGYCTPGMVMACTALLKENPKPSEHEIRHALEGNICRCTGYEMIVNSVRWASEHGDAQ